MGTSAATALPRTTPSSAHQRRLPPRSARSSCKASSRALAAASRTGTGRKLRSFPGKFAWTLWEFPGWAPDAGEGIWLEDSWGGLCRSGRSSGGPWTPQLYLKRCPGMLGFSTYIWIPWFSVCGQYEPGKPQNFSRFFSPLAKWSICTRLKLRDPGLEDSSRKGESPHFWTSESQLV